MSEQDTAPDSPEDALAKQRAASDLEFIFQLENSKAFQSYFLRRLRDKIAAREARILDEMTPDSEIGKERAVLSALRDIERMIIEDGIGCRSILGVRQSAEIDMATAPVLLS